jgi:signal transduction histidine kinase
VSVVEVDRLRSRIPRLGSLGSVIDVVVIVVATASVVRVLVQPVEPRLTVGVLALWATLPLLLRRRFPLLAPLTALFVGCLGLTLVLPGALWEQLQFFFCALLCSWCLGEGSTRLRAYLGLAAALLVAGAAVATDPVHHTVGDLVFGLTITAAAWAAGYLFGRRSHQASAAEQHAEQVTAERERRTAEALAAERLRIARELHDVIGHTVSLMIVQAGAAEQVLGPGEDQARVALQNIRQSGKGALVELRHLLGLLRDDDPLAAGPPPGLAQVDQLVAAVRSTGLRVHLEAAGKPRPLSPGVDRAAYRIVQEALTNAIRHAGPAIATVAIRWEPDVLVLTITDDGRTVAPTGEGRGIIGMRERARLYGGEFDAGHRPEGGFRVVVRLPA